MEIVRRNGLIGWQDFVNLVLGGALFISPWTVGFADPLPDEGGASATFLAGFTIEAWNAWIVGVLVAAMAILALVTRNDKEEWVNAALGAWTALSPWTLGFALVSAATATHVIIGGAILAYAAWELGANRRDRTGLPGSPSL